MTSVPTLLASASPISPADRLDLLIHAVAQLPEPVTAEIYGDGGLSRQLGLLIEAYGLDDRVSVARRPPRSRDGLVVYPSRHNARTAPVRPYKSSGGSLLLDDLAAGNGRRASDSAASLEGGPAGHVVTSMAGLIDAVVGADEPVAPIGSVNGLSGHRVGIVTNYPTHYRVSLFNRLAARLSDHGASLKVLFTDAAPAARPWMRGGPLEFEHEFLRALPVRGAATDFSPFLERRLRAAGPSVVISGGFSPLTSLRIARACARDGTTFGVWSGETASMGTARGRLRALQRRWVLARAGFAIAYGYESGEYLRSLAPALPVVYGRNTAPFPPAASRSDPGEVVRILAVSRAVPRKGLEVLIDATRLLDMPLRLTIAGGGDQLEALERRAAGDPRIDLLGTVDSDRVGELYRESDVFAFPTRADPFGLVMVEAFAAGLAVATSTAPGANGDLAVSDRNCLIVGDHTPLAWAAALRRLIEDGELRRSLGTAASATVRGRWTMEHSAQAMICGIRLGIVGGRR